MSYTVEDLDRVVEDEGYRYSYTDGDEDGSTGWHEFNEAVQSTYTWLKKDGEYVRDENKRLIKVDLDEPGALLPGIGRAVLVEDFGGEGQGDQYWFVFSVTDADGNVRLFRRNGWYASYSGGEYDGPTEEVVPKEKTITVYVTI